MLENNLEAELPLVTHDAPEPGDMEAELNQDHSEPEGEVMVASNLTTINDLDISDEGETSSSEMVTAVSDETGINAHQTKRPGRLLRKPARFDDYVT